MTAADDVFQTLKNFFETRQAAKTAMMAVEPGIEISIVIGDTLECALFRQNNQPIVEQRPAQNPDVIFHIKPEAVYVLANSTKDEIADIGVNILKEVLAGSINIKVPGRLMNIVSRGYLDMVKQGGMPVMNYLAQQGLGSIPKILNTIKNMKR